MKRTAGSAPIVFLTDELSRLADAYGLSVFCTDSAWPTAFAVTFPAFAAMQIHWAKSSGQCSSGHTADGSHTRLTPVRYSKLIRGPT